MLQRERTLSLALLLFMTDHVISAPPYRETSPDTIHSSHIDISNNKVANLISTGYENQNNKAGDVVTLLDHPFNINPDGSFSISPNSNSQNGKDVPNVSLNDHYIKTSQVEGADHFFVQQSVDQAVIHHEDSNNYPLPQTYMNGDQNNQEKKSHKLRLHATETKSHQRNNPGHGLSQQYENSESNLFAGTGKDNFTQTSPNVVKHQDMSNKQTIQHVSSDSIPRSKENQVWNTYDSGLKNTKNRENELNTARSEAEAAHAKFLGLLNPWGVGMWAKKGNLPPHGYDTNVGYGNKRSMQSNGEQQMLLQNKQIQPPDIHISGNNNVFHENNNSGRHSDYSSATDSGFHKDPNTGNFETQQKIPNLGKEIHEVFDSKIELTQTNFNDYVSKIDKTGENRKLHHGTQPNNAMETWITDSIPEEIFNGVKQLNSKPNDLLKPSQKFENLNHVVPNVYNIPTSSEAVPHGQMIRGKHPVLFFPGNFDEKLIVHSHQIIPHGGLPDTAMAEADIFPFLKTIPFDTLGSSRDTQLGGDTNFLKHERNHVSNVDPSVRSIDNTSIDKIGNKSQYLPKTDNFTEPASTNTEFIQSHFSTYDTTQGDNILHDNLQTKAISNSNSGGMPKIQSHDGLFSGSFIQKTLPPGTDNHMQHSHTAGQRELDSVQGSGIPETKLHYQVFHPIQHPNKDINTANHQNIPHAANHQNIPHAANHKNIPHATNHQNIPHAANHQNIPHEHQIKLQDNSGFINNDHNPGSEKLNANINLSQSWKVQENNQSYENKETTNINFNGNPLPDFYKPNTFNPENNHEIVNAKHQSQQMTEIMSKWYAPSQNQNNATVGQRSNYLNKEAANKGQQSVQSYGNSPYTPIGNNNQNRALVEQTGYNSDYGRAWDFSNQNAKDITSGQYKSTQIDVKNTAVVGEPKDTSNQRGNIDTREHNNVVNPGDWYPLAGAESLNNEELGQTRGTFFQGAANKNGQYNIQDFSNRNYTLTGADIHNTAGEKQIFKNTNHGSTWDNSQRHSGGFANGHSPTPWINFKNNAVEEQILYNNSNHESDKSHHQNIQGLDGGPYISRGNKIQNNAGQDQTSLISNKGESKFNIHHNVHNYAEGQYTSLVPDIEKSRIVEQSRYEPSQGLNNSLRYTQGVAGAQNTYFFPPAENAIQTNEWLDHNRYNSNQEGGLDIQTGNDMKNNQALEQTTLSSNQVNSVYINQQNTQAIPSDKYTLTGQDIANNAIVNDTRFNSYGGSTKDNILQNPGRLRIPNNAGVEQAGYFSNKGFATENTHQNVRSRSEGHFTSSGSDIQKSAMEKQKTYESSQGMARNNILQNTQDNGSGQKTHFLPSTGNDIQNNGWVKEVRFNSNQGSGLPTGNNIKSNQAVEHSGYSSNPLNFVDQSQQHAEVIANEQYSSLRFDIPNNAAVNEKGINTNEGILDKSQQNTRNLNIQNNADMEQTYLTSFKGIARDNIHQNVNDLAKGLYTSSGSAIQEIATEGQVRYNSSQGRAMNNNLQNTNGIANSQDTDFFPPLGNDIQFNGWVEQNKHNSNFGSDLDNIHKGILGFDSKMNIPKGTDNKNNQVNSSPQNTQTITNNIPNNVAVNKKRLNPNNGRALDKSQQNSRMIEIPNNTEPQQTRVIPNKGITRNDINQNVQGLADGKYTSSVSDIQRSAVYEQNKYDSSQRMDRNNILLNTQGIGSGQNTHFPSSTRNIQSNRWAEQTGFNSNQGSGLNIPIEANVKSNQVVEQTRFSSNNVNPFDSGPQNTQTIASDEYTYKGKDIPNDEAENGILLNSNEGRLRALDKIQQHTRGFDSKQFFSTKTENRNFARLHDTNFHSKSGFPENSEQIAKGVSGEQYIPPGFDIQNYGPRYQNMYDSNKSDLKERNNELFRNYASMQDSQNANIQPNTNLIAIYNPNERRNQSDIFPSSSHDNQSKYETDFLRNTPIQRKKSPDASEIHNGNTFSRPTIKINDRSSSSNTRDNRSFTSHTHSNYNRSPSRNTRMPNEQYSSIDTHIWNGQSSSHDTHMGNVYLNTGNTASGHVSLQSTETGTGDFQTIGNQREIIPDTRLLDQNPYSKGNMMPYGRYTDEFVKMFQNYLKSSKGNVTNKELNGIRESNLDVSPIAGKDIDVTGRTQDSTDFESKGIMQRGNGQPDFVYISTEAPSTESRSQIDEINGIQDGKYDIQQLSNFETILATQKSPIKEDVKNSHSKFYAQDNFDLKKDNGISSKTKDGLESLTLKDNHEDRIKALHDWKAFSQNNYHETFLSSLLHGYYSYLGKQSDYKGDLSNSSDNYSNDSDNDADDSNDADEDSDSDSDEHSANDSADDSDDTDEDSDKDYDENSDNDSDNDDSDENGNDNDDNSNDDDDDDDEHGDDEDDDEYDDDEYDDDDKHDDDDDDDDDDDNRAKSLGFRNSGSKNYKNYGTKGLRNKLNNNKEYFKNGVDFDIRLQSIKIGKNDTSIDTYGFHNNNNADGKRGGKNLKKIRNTLIHRNDRKTTRNNDNFGSKKLDTVRKTMLGKILNKNNKPGPLEYKSLKRQIQIKNYKIELQTGKTKQSVRVKKRQQRKGKRRNKSKKVRQSKKRSRTVKKNDKQASRLIRQNAGKKRNGRRNVAARQRMADKSIIVNKNTKSQNDDKSSKKTNNRKYQNKGQRENSSKHRKTFKNSKTKRKRNKVRKGKRKIIGKPKVGRKHNG